jgi:sulfate permease, SulP family
MMPRIAELIPILDWGRSYGRADFRADLTAGVIVLFITIPQVIAYAYLAGMPPETGLYAAILSLIGYAAFGSSKTLAVGPAAIISMMTLESVSRFAEPHTAEFLQTATQLAVLTGMLLIAENTELRYRRELSVTCGGDRVYRGGSDIDHHHPTPHVARPRRT